VLLLVAIHSIYIHGGRALETPNHTGHRADYFFINEQIESTRIRGAKKASRHNASSSKSNTTIIKSISRSTTVLPVGISQHACMHGWMDAPFSHSKERVTSV
jgi:hypothetical protein